MESKEPITAEEFIKNKYGVLPESGKDSFSLEDVCNSMKEFAKWHRKEMIEAIKKNVMIRHNGEIDYDSIENAYREDQIV